MSGWNASRPTWDPEGGVSDSTPGFPDQEDGRSRPGNGRHSYGQSGQQGQPRQPSFPGYDPEDLWPQDQGEGGSSNGAGGQHASSGQYRYGTRASLGLPQEDYPAADYGQPGQQSEQRDYAQPAHPGRHAAGTARSAADQEYASQDYAARMDPALQDFFAPQPSRSGTAPSGRQPASAPQPPGAPGAPGPGYPGQPGYSGQEPRPGGRQPATQRDGQPRRPTGPQQSFQASHGTQAPQPSQAPWASQPSQSRPAPPWASEPGQAGHADPWETPAPRPGSRSASHADRGRDRDTRGSQRGRSKVFIAVGLVVVLAIAAGAYLVLRKHGTTPPASMPPTTAPRTTPSASHPASGKAVNPATGTAYTLSTPATAGGYAKLATASSTVTSTAAATAQSVREQAVNSGGKVTSQVSGYYQLSSGQVMSFAGYEGTFNPAKVLASLGQVGQGGQTYPQGAHGGELACIPSAGTPGGTVCVWVTTTTLGVTEFFASTGAPETVTNQAKAAQDTVNFRADAEAAKS
jgi:hypothetical protein